MSTTVNTTSYYTFGSPRYNSVNQLATNLIPEDNAAYIALNGTYDKFFPLYRLIETDEPVHELVKQDSTHSPVKGDLKITNTSYKTFSMKYGAIKGRTELPVNSNLEKQTVSYSNWSSIRLNPAWCVIQQTEKLDNNQTKYEPSLLVRALGTNATILQIHALDLDADIKNTITAWKSSDFPVGLIVKYKDNAWKCIKATRKTPPEKPLKSPAISEDWLYINYNDNVFNADIFFLSSSGDTNYLKEVTDKKRKFHPVKDNKDDDLVCWNLAYYE